WMLVAIRSSGPDRSRMNRAASIPPGAIELYADPATGRPTYRRLASVGATVSPIAAATVSASQVRREALSTTASRTTPTTVTASAISNGFANTLSRQPESRQALGTPVL